MNRNMKFALAAVAAVVVLWLGYRSANSMYFGPRAALQTQILDLRDELKRIDDAERDQPRLRNELQAIADRTLGSDVETVDHRLRTRLNRLAEHIGLQSPSVGTASSIRRQSPARSVLPRQYRDEIDYVELAGWIGGQGSFEQALGLVASLEQEPWIKRIDLLKLDPKDNGGKFEISVHLTTLFLPGRAPRAELATSFAAADLSAYQGFVRSNPFRLPPPAEVVAAAQKVVASTPAGFAYEQWTLTGVAENAAGAEIWLLNSQTREAKRLALGERLQEAVFLAASGDSAEFELGQQRFQVSIGQNLGDRAPLNQ
jgi:hypothetical protein